MVDGFLLFRGPHGLARNILERSGCRGSGGVVAFLGGAARCLEALVGGCI